MRADSENHDAEELRALARLAAKKVLTKDIDGLPSDPRDSVFASAYIRECDRLLAMIPPLLQDAIESAGNAAEGTNVDRYQGVVEVLQNADDRRAGEVRVALRDRPGGKQMLVVHNGLPVEYEHVLAMMLPFVSTKRDDAELRGRFGIGLKTLRRICTDIEVHGTPYHFGSGAAVNIVERAPEDAIDGFYDPQRDTLLVLDLNEEFDPGAFALWFENWSDDGLIFLDFVRRFEFMQADGTRLERTTVASRWTQLPVDGCDLLRLERRTVKAGDRHYRIHRGTFAVPEGNKRFHKGTGQTSSISIAASDGGEKFGIFVGLRTRIPTALPFAIDAQFDPVASRESIQENKWNQWLLGKVATVLAAAATSELRDSPRSAWHLVPVPGEGVVGESWPAEALASVLADARNRFAAQARFGDARDRLLPEVAYETETVTSLLEEDDLAALAPGHWPLPAGFRDRSGRWRLVLSALGQSREVGPGDVIRGAGEGLFAGKGADWWMNTATVLTAVCLPSEIFGAPIWLTEQGALVAASLIGTSDRKIVCGDPLPDLARRHALFDVLHPVFAHPAANRAISWLVQNAAFTASVDAHDEILAFASAFENDPVRVTPAELRELRDLLNPMSDSRAERLGERLGRAVLIEAVEGETKGRRDWRRPCDLYLPRSIDKDLAYWPAAAWGLSGIWWAHPLYDEGLRTGLGKRRKREDGTRARGARKFLTLLGAETGPRLEPGDAGSERSEARKASMRRANATELASDVRSPDLDRVLAAIGNRKIPKRERRDRAISLLRSLSREWTRRLAAQSAVKGQHRARVNVHERGRHDALWLDRLKEEAWIPIGRDRFRTPASAIVRTPETQAIYKSEDFIVGIGPEDLDEDFIDTLGLTAHVRASDLLSMIEDMHNGEIDFDAARVYLAYQHFSRILPKTPWPSVVGDIPINEFRSRFARGSGLVLVEVGDEGADWRQPVQVRRGKPILPTEGLYVPDREIYRSLWTALAIGETSVDDCCDYLKDHAALQDPSADLGTLIQIYRHIDALVRKSPASAQACRHLPLACAGVWRARRPIHLVTDERLRERLAAAMPDRFFWQPPCDIRSISAFVDILSLTRVRPRLRPVPDLRAEEQGEDRAPTFAAAVDHLSNSLGKRDASLRQALKLPWDAFRAARIFVYDADVPVDVEDFDLGWAVRTGVPALFRPNPPEFHVSSEALELRDGAGAAIADMFEPGSTFPFDAEWVVAWQSARRSATDALRFAVDDEAHKTKVQATAEAIEAQKAKGPVKLTAKKDGKTEAEEKEPPPRQLKDIQPGILSVSVVEGKAPMQGKGPVKPALHKRPPRTGRGNGSARVVNTSYTNGELEDFAWDVLVHVLETANGPELVDFRKRHGVGADGAFDWDKFVELKATGRSMQTSVTLMPAEFKRALERGNDYILALVHNCEKGSNTGIKLIFDPARRASYRETEGVRLNGLADAPGIIVALGPDGEILIPDEPENGAAPASEPD